MFRIIVQDSRLTPTSGKVVAPLGSYDPHAKTVILDKEKAAFYLEHGAQPSERVASLLKQEGVKLPDWVKLPAKKERTVRNAEKRRSTAPAQPVEAPAPEAAAPEAPQEAADAVTPADETAPEVAPSEAAETPVETPEAPEVSEAPEAATTESSAEPAAAATPESSVATESAESVSEDDAAKDEAKA